MNLARRFTWANRIGSGVLLLALALFVSLVAIPWLVAYLRPADSRSPGYVAPAWSLSSLDGQTISLGGQRGKPVVLVFVASWCEVCRKEMPMMVETYLAHRPHDVQFLAVDSYEDRGAVEKFRDEFDIPFPILLDTNGKVAELYDIKGTPTNFFIDRRGQVRDLVIGGPLSRAYLDKEIVRLLEVAAN